MSGDVAGFIEARVVEWQATAEAARDVERVQWQDDDLSDQPVEWLRHYASHSPARVLRQVAALRAILGEHQSEQAFGRVVCVVREGQEDWPCDAVRALAGIWSDHPDYRQEWAP